MVEPQSTTEKSTTERGPVERRTDTHLTAPRPRQLARLTSNELEQVWRQAPAAQPEQMQGDLQARFVYLRGERMLPTTFRRLLKGLLFSPLFPLRAKRTRGTYGENRFGLGMGQIGAMHFDVRRDTAWDDDKDVLVLDYNIDDNAPWLHPIRDEMCQLDADLLLGRMGWRTRRSTWLGLYFTLARVS